MGVFDSTAYSRAAGTVGSFLTKYSIADYVTDGKYSDVVGKVFETAAEYSATNAAINVTSDAIKGEGVFAESGYTENTGKVAKFLTEHSIADFVTDGKYSDFVAGAASKVSQYSLANILTNIFS